MSGHSERKSRPIRRGSFRETERRPIRTDFNETLQSALRPTASPRGLSPSRNVPLSGSVWPRGASRKTTSIKTPEMRWNRKPRRLDAGTGKRQTAMALRFTRNLRMTGSVAPIRPENFHRQVEGQMEPSRAYLVPLEQGRSCPRSLGSSGLLSDVVDATLSRVLTPSGKRIGPGKQESQRCFMPQPGVRVARRLI